jgi:hypothetical protein
LTQSFVAGLVPVAQGSPRITLSVYGLLFANADDRAAQVVEAAFGAALTECERDRWNPPLISMAIRWQFVVLPSDRHDKILKYQHGWVAEWFKAPVLKFAAASATPSRFVPKHIDLQRVALYWRAVSSCLVSARTTLFGSKVGSVLNAARSGAH